jgi:hypothetical protein
MIVLYRAIRKKKKQFDAHESMAPLAFAIFVNKNYLVKELQLAELNFQGLEKMARSEDDIHNRGFI